MRSFCMYGVTAAKVTGTSSAKLCGPLGLMTLFLGTSSGTQSQHSFLIPLTHLIRYIILHKVLGEENRFIRILLHFCFYFYFFFFIVFPPLGIITECMRLSGVIQSTRKAPKIATVGAYRATRAAPPSNHQHSQRMVHVINSFPCLPLPSYLCTTSHFPQNFQFSGAFINFSLSMFLHTAVDPGPCNRPLANAMGPWLPPLLLPNIYPVHGRGLPLSSSLPLCCFF